MNTNGDIILEAKGISKEFPGVKALDDVSLSLRAGRLTALLGENGAGKSTLMNIVAGVFPPDAGEVNLLGRRVNFANPREAHEAGISMIFQELNLIPNLTVAENIFLGREPLNRLGLIDNAEMNLQAEALLKRLDLDIEPTAVLGGLRVGQQQVVEIAKAISSQARVLIMDEPTSAITEHEVEVLYGIIDNLKQQGVAIAYITHKFEELARIGDDAVVMRDGRLIGSAAIKDLTQEAMMQMMVGRELNQVVDKSKSNPGKEALRIENISLSNPDCSGAWLLQDISLNVRKGEVLGIFGLMGAGRTELLETLFGLHPKRATGAVYIDGQLVKINTPTDAIELGLAMAPEDRKSEGLVMSMTVAENASLACLSRVEHFGLLNESRENQFVDKIIQRFRVKTPSQEQVIRNLSGGNQQKVILGKWLATQPKVLLLDEPTRGIDVHAKGEIYALIEEMVAEGLAVIVVSSELPEILAISDRIVVLCEGCKTAEFDRAEANENLILKAALSN